MAEFQSGGVRIAFDDIAPQNSRTVLLVHGFASNRHEMWRRLGWYGVFERKGFRIVALDCRGHGESEKPVDSLAYSGTEMSADILRLLDHLQIARADLMGYSMGARLALAASVTKPARFSHLVLGGAGGRLFEPSPAGNPMATAMDADDPESIAEPLLRSFRHFADEQGENRLALAALSRADLRFDYASACANLRLPVLVAAGARDTLAGDPETLARAFPNGRAVTLPGCDHFSAIPHALFKATVFDFLDDVLE